MLIKLENGVKSRNEWCLLEFQGEIVGDLVGNELGKLLVKDEGRVEMEIGGHFLEGSIVRLKMPFLIIQKVTNDSKDNISQGCDSDATIPIQGYVRSKIIFKTRPKPIGLKRVLP